MKNDICEKLHIGNNQRAKQTQLRQTDTERDRLTKKKERRGREIHGEEGIRREKETDTQTSRQTD